MKRHIARRVLAATVGLGSLTTVHLAHAYNWRTHSRMVEVASQLMLAARAAGEGGPSVPPPPGLQDPSGQWPAFVSAAGTAYGRLSQLQSGLPNPNDESVANCHYAATEELNQVPTEQIEQMDLLPLKGGTVPGGSAVNANDHGDLESLNPNGCTEVSDACTDGTDRRDTALTLGRVLGWQAASVDDHMDDTFLYAKPTSSDVGTVLELLAGASLGDLADAELLGLDLEVGAVALTLSAVECLIDWIFGGGPSCGSDLQANAAGLAPIANLENELNPVTILTSGWDVGVDSTESYDYVGLWHFIDVASFDGKRNDYNPATFPGLFYEQAGPYGVPGDDDEVISLGADLVGLSVDPNETQGISKYGSLDQIARGASDWGSRPIGHIQFSPVDNLAQWGWNQFTSASSSAYFLGWPLHAIGDASEPQHVAGTTAWGHRPYEDEVDNLLDTQLLPPPPSACTPSTAAPAPLVAAGAQDPSSPTLASNSDQANRILTQAFYFWTKYQARFGQGPFPIRQIVQDVAQQTYALATAAPGTSVYNDAASDDWFSEAEPVVDDLSGSTQIADDEYAQSGPQMIPMLELGTGATMAFLMGASLTATAAPCNPNQTCLQGEYDPALGICAGGGGTIFYPPAPPTKNTVCPLGPGKPIGTPQ